MKLSKRHITIISIAIAICILGSYLLPGSLITKTVLAADVKRESRTSGNITELSKRLPEIVIDKREPVDKHETVYVLMDADGQVDRVIVSEQLSNPEQANSIEDFSVLEDIQNASGTETFQQDGNRLSWEAQGKRIDYQGTFHGEMPLEVNISYYLNGQKLSADDIVGKSGDVKIRFDYTISRQDIIQGENCPHPYTLLSGLVFDNQYFSDVQVSRGKVIDDGSKTLVCGISFPGLLETLGSDAEELGLADYLEITAHTDKFTLGGTYSVALSGVLPELQWDNQEGVEAKLNELNAGLNTLNDSSKLLVRGSDQASQGAVQLDQGFQTLAANLEELQSAGDKLAEGSTTLATSLQELSDHSADLNAGITQLEQSIFASASLQLAQAMGQDAIALTPENYEEVLTGLAQSLSQNPSGTNPEATAQLTQLKQQLDSMASLTAGLRAYTQGVDQASAGSARLAEGATTLQQGVIALNQGAGELAQGSHELNGGLAKLKNGMIRFDQLGIQRLVNTFRQEGLQDLGDRLQDIQEASRQDFLLGGKTEDMSGDSVLIFKTASITLK